MIDDLGHDDFMLQVTRDAKRKLESLCKKGR
jgi:hypothetical protein